jgi:hypothetical protein
MPLTLNLRSGGQGPELPSTYVPAAGMSTGCRDEKSMRDNIKAVLIVITGLVVFIFYCCDLVPALVTAGGGASIRAAASLVSSSSRRRDGSMRIARMAPSPSSAAEIVKATV